PRDGVWRVELAALTDPECVDHVVVAALGITDHTGRPPREVLPGPLAGRPRLRGPGGFAHLVRGCAGRVSGLPGRAPGRRGLAVELAAGRLGTLSAAQLLERFDDRFRLLSGGRRDGLPRHRALRTAVGWSHELCTPRERLLWARLSVFAGGFDLEAAEYVCGGDGLPAEEVLDVLSALLAQSVVTREE